MRRVSAAAPDAPQCFRCVLVLSGAPAPTVGGGDNRIETMPVAEYLLAVEIQQFAQQRSILDGELVGVASEDRLVFDAVPAEMEETQRIAVHRPSVARPAEPPLRKVPIGDVVSGMMKDARVLDERRQVIGPSLIDE